MNNHNPLRKEYRPQSFLEVRCAVSSPPLESQQRTPLPAASPAGTTFPIQDMRRQSFFRTGGQYEAKKGGIPPTGLHVMPEEGGESTPSACSGQNRQLKFKLRTPDEPL